MHLLFVWLKLDVFRYFLYYNLVTLFDDNDALKYRTFIRLTF